MDSVYSGPSRVPAGQERTLSRGSGDAHDQALARKTEAAGARAAHRRSGRVRRAALAARRVRVWGAHGTVGPVVTVVVVVSVVVVNTVVAGSVTVSWVVTVPPGRVTVMGRGVVVTVDP